MSIRIYEATLGTLKGKAIAGVTLELEEGHIYGLFGENGAGKSTLMSVLAGRMRLDLGGVFVDGEPLYNVDASLEKVALARPGEPFPFGMRVRKALKDAAALRSGFDMGRALELAETFGVDPEARIATLSTGRAALFRCLIALASGAEFVLLDEPALGVDAAGRRALYREIVRDFAESGRTYVIASHLVAETEAIADSAIVMHRGRVVASGSVEDVLDGVWRISGPSAAVAEAASGLDVVASDVTGALATAVIRINAGAKGEAGTDASAGAPASEASSAPTPATFRFPEGISATRATLKEYVEAVCGREPEGGN